MIKIDNIEVMGWEPAIRGMRNPMNSWDKSDSYHETFGHYIIGDNDLDLMERLAAGGSVHAKYRRMIIVYMDITAPLYWWKEFDTYKVGTVANSCSTMHKIHAKKFEDEDFSMEHLIEDEDHAAVFISSLHRTIADLNTARELFLKTKDKLWWWQMIQLLPSSYNQKRTVLLNYEVLSHIYHDRKDHKLDEWREFCKMIGSLPYAQIITMEGINEGHN